MKVKKALPTFTRKIYIDNALDNGITRYTLANKNINHLGDGVIKSKWKTWLMLAELEDYEGRMGQQGFIDWLCATQGYTLILESTPLSETLMWDEHL